MKIKLKNNNIVELLQGDITALNVDAVVNAANKTLLGGGGVDGAIHSAAGPLLIDECKKLNGCSTGCAKITKGYLLKAKHIIHTVGPIYGNKSDDSILLKNCYENCLKLAIENNIKSIAFPAISCGVYKYPIKDACKIAVDTVIDSLNNCTIIEKIVFVVFSLDYYMVYQDYITKIGEV